MHLSLKLSAVQLCKDFVESSDIFSLRILFPLKKYLPAQIRLLHKKEKHATTHVYKCMCHAGDKKSTLLTYALS